MYKFKKGDKVWIKNIEGITSGEAKVGMTGVVIQDESKCPWIKLPDGLEIYVAETGLELLAENFSNNYQTKPKKTIMQKVSTMMKKLLDADTQALVKAGLIDGDLNLTQEGTQELRAINFMANKGAMVARAQEIITEAKENK